MIVDLPCDDAEPTIEQLASLYADKKAAVKDAQKDLDDVFDQIKVHPDVLEAIKVKPIGSSTVDNVLKVSPGVTRNWDQEKLNVLRDQVADEFWPFDQVWKEDAAAMKVFKERFPDLYKAIAVALSTKPRKMSVEVIS